MATEIFVISAQFYVNWMMGEDGPEVEDDETFEINIGAQSTLRGAINFSIGFIENHVPEDNGSLGSKDPICEIFVTRVVLDGSVLDEPVSAKVGIGSNSDDRGRQHIRETLQKVFGKG